MAIDPNTGLDPNATPGVSTTQPVGSPQAGPAISGSGGFAFDPTKNPTDPAYVAQFVQYLSTLPNADPQLKNDPNYYIQAIINNGGGVTQDNANYWQGHVTNPANYGGGGGAAAGGGAGAALWADPGFQARLQYGLSAVQNSAMARGTGLSSGLLKDLSDYAGTQASGEFNNAFNRNMSIADLGYGATGQAANYSTGAASSGAAGTIGASNAATGALNNIGQGTASAYTLGTFFGQNNPDNS